MKRIVLGVAGVLVAALLTVVGLIMTRPDLFPGGAGPGAVAVSNDGGAGLYCDEHGVPEKFCTICHPELASGLLLCPEHGNIPEDICIKCHPELEQKYNIKACPKGHGLPQFFCVECANSQTTATDAPDDGWCTTHNLPEAQCTACLYGPDAHEADAPDRVCRQPLPLVRLASASLDRRIGLRTAPALAETHAHTLEANAETDFDANRFADVSPRVSGFLSEVKSDLGERVRAGDVLAVVDSPEVSAAKSRHISAVALLTLATVSYDRVKTLAARGALPAKQDLEALTALNQAESAALEAAQALRNLGFTDTELGRISSEKETSSLLPIVAPIDGTVVSRHAVRGEAVQDTTVLFAVADTSTMWLWVDVYEADLERVAAGQVLTFTVSGAEAYAFEGRVTWVGAEVDPTTRTTRVRAELGNAAGRLRARQFGRATVQVGEPHEVLVVPKAAIQNKDGTGVVFLPQGGGVFRPQRVVSKASNRGEVVEVSWGLKPGDRVVTAGSFWLKTEVMRGAIGAGCCE